MRNNALDLSRLVASFFIIVVHSGNFPEMTPEYADMFQASSRWAVPFFFLVSGYLMGDGKDLKVSHKLNRLFVILFYSSMIYVPIIYISTGYSFHKSVALLASFTTLRSGTSFHLWFLPSLMLGVLITNYFIKNVNALTGLIISVALLIAYWMSDIGQAFGLLKNKNEAFYLFRTLHGISLVYIGYLLSIRNSLKDIGKKYALVVLIIGVSLMIIEVPALKLFSNVQTLPRQFPFFSVFSAIALLSVCINTNIKEGFFSKAGRDYSLGIYLIHPFILYFMVPYLNRHGINISIVNLIFSFIISLFVMHTIKKVLPIAYNKLNGIGVK
ncbi:acyltransferase family protein [Enterobacter kobei]|uniref:acyltransferase family protein n=1 Tax=Enterobacter kobei TaxID=208224 RepID=UPI001C706BFF|nr:acyltransferase family protein [Enterobacter kobei]MBW9428035.1 acyltransferase family protein [Enterobacter kobei]